MSANAKSPAAKRAAMRVAPEEDPEFQIAPMIDILLVLLVFFMSIASTEVLQTNDKVKLCVAKDAKDKKHEAVQGQSIVNLLWAPINNAGSLDVDGRAFALPDDITPVLKAKVDGDPNMRVLLRADKNARFDYTKAVLKALARAGVTNVTFSVVDKEVPGAAAATP